MSWRIITDEATQTAALISDDPLYALGPVIEADTAEEAVEAIQAFAAACDPAPDQQPTIRLMAEWQSYVQYLAGLQEAAVQAASRPAVDPVIAGSGQSLGITHPPGGGPEDAPEPPLQDGSDAPGAGNSVGSNGLPGSGDAGGIEAGPIEGQQQVCWCCGGSGKLNLAGTQTDCNVCQGSGQVEAVAR